MSIILALIIAKPIGLISTNILIELIYPVFTTVLLKNYLLLYSFF